LQAVILAGGLGTRLLPVTRKIPKAMVSIHGKPFLEYEVGLLRSQGVAELVVCLGHLGNMIRDYFGDGRRFGVAIKYSEDGPRLLGPAGALKQAEPLLGDSFFVTYGDVYLRAPYSSMMRRLEASVAAALMAAYRNENRLGRSDLQIERGRVARYDKKGGAGMKWINYGVTAMKKRALDVIPAGKAMGEEEFYGALIRRNKLLAFPVTRRFYEIGNPESLDQFSRFIRGRGHLARP